MTDWGLLIWKALYRPIPCTFAPQPWLSSGFSGEAWKVEGSSACSSLEAQPEGRSATASSINRGKIRKVISRSQGGTGNGASRHILMNRVTPRMNAAIDAATSSPKLPRMTYSHTVEMMLKNDGMRPSIL